MVRVALVVLFLAAACHPATGDARCDDPNHDAGVVIDEAGWTLDCDPPMAGRSGTGRIVAGWADTTTRTVYVWPDNLPTQRRADFLRKTLLHEAAHTLGFHDEWRPSTYAWCKMTPASRDGIGFVAPYPTENDCRRYRW